MQTKINRNMFKLDADNKTINIDICIYFNNALSSNKSRQRPFTFTLPLNFSKKEVIKEMSITFDASKVKKHVLVEDFKSKILEVAKPSAESLNLVVNGQIDENNLYEDGPDASNANYNVQ